MVPFPVTFYWYLTQISTSTSTLIFIQHDVIFRPIDALNVLCAQFGHFRGTDADVSCNVAGVSCNVAHVSCTVAGVSCNVTRVSCNITRNTCNITGNTCTITRNTCMQHYTKHLQHYRKHVQHYTNYVQHYKCQMKQQCTNSVQIVKNSQTAKMTIGVPIVTCLHRVRRIHKAVMHIRNLFCYTY